MADERIASQIGAVPVFADLKEDVRQQIAEILIEIGDVCTVELGEAIFSEGAEDDHSGCVLLEGTVEVFREGVPAIQCAGPDLFGEMQQLEATAQRTATVQAVTDGRILLFSWSPFLARIGATLAVEDQVTLRDALKNAADRRRSAIQPG